MLGKKLASSVVIAALCLTAAGCKMPWEDAKATSPTNVSSSTAAQPVQGNLEIGDLTAYSYLNKLAVTESLPVKVYLDGTASMAGYTNKNAPSVFKDVIKSIEPIFHARWKSNKIEFVRFGDAYVPFTGEGFLDFEKEGFYTDKDTRLDNVIKDTDNSRLNIIITDLFQTNQYYTSLSNALASKCFADQADRSFAIIGIKSQFKGKIFDIANHAPVEYSSDDSKPASFRPLYLLVIGNDADVKVFAYELQRKFADVRVSLFTNEYGHGNTLALGDNFGKTKGGFQNKGDKDGKSADGIIHVKAKAGDKITDSLEFVTKRLPVVMPEKYAVEVTSLEKLTGGSWNPLAKQKASFQEAKNDGLLDGSMELNVNGADVKSAVKLVVDAKKENEGKYKLNFDLYASREDYVNSQDVFQDWSFNENHVPASDAEIGVKTQSISEFTRLVADKHYMQDKPGLKNIELLLDID